MSKIKVNIKKRRTGTEILCGGDHLLVVYPYGLSSRASSIQEELEKVNLAIKLQADIVKDNSVGHKDWIELLKRVSEETSVPVGASATLAAGNMAVAEGKQPIDVTEKSFYKGFETLANYCDCIEIFPSLTREAIKITKKRKFFDWTISRAGNIIMNYLSNSNSENPYYENLNWFLDYAKKEDITLILGNGLRAACIADSLDEAQMYEVEINRVVAEEAIKKGVRIIAGVFGHIDPSKINEIKKIREKINIPIGGLGPLLTDIALGYDHINAAIGIVMMRKYIDWVSLITPSEHIGMPSLDDVSEGMTAFNIARHILELSEGKAQEKDLKMTRARINTNLCLGMIDYAINPFSKRLEKFRNKKLQGKGCTLCGNWCPLIMKLEQEDVKKYD